MSQALLSRHLSAQFLSASRSIGHARRDLKAFASDRVFFAQTTRSYTCFARGGPQATLGITQPSGPRGSRRSSLSLEERLLTNASRRGSIRAIRREPISQAQRQAEMEEEAKKIDLAPHKLLQKGDPDSFQAVIKDVNPVGYFLTLPNGREGYLPALDLGFTGGIVILEKLFKVGQELTVRIVRRGGGGREILSMKKPEFAPNTDPRFTFSERLKNMQQGKS